MRSYTSLLLISVCIFGLSFGQTTTEDSLLTAPAPSSSTSGSGFDAPYVPAKTGNLRVPVQAADESSQNGLLKPKLSVDGKVPTGTQPASMQNDPRNDPKFKALLAQVEADNKQPSSFDSDPRNSGTGTLFF